MTDEFYTGYLPQAPPGIARRVRLAVAVLLVAAVALAVAVVTGQRGFSPAVYEFGVTRDFEGVVREKPYPMLEVDRPGRGAGVSRYYLVNPFKAGAEVAGRDGEPTRLRGSLLYFGEETMIEILPEELSEASGTAAAPSAPVSLGAHRLRGRIVDSKCYLGIMKPGDGKIHRACAARCIRGGIPPLFVLSDALGDVRHLLLVGADGAAIGSEVLDFVAEPLEVEGEVLRSGDLWILRADPASFRRL
jgi:hypothetical protein